MTYSSQNRITNSVIRLIGEETMDNIEQYVLDVKNRSYKSFNSLDEAKSFFDGYMQNFYSNSNLSDIENIKYYTGPSFKEINAVLRNNWNYEVSGPKNRDDYSVIARDISDSMNKASNELPSDIRVYRGVSLDSFRSYGINSISDLKSMEGQYFYESGFTSTSLFRDSSSFNSNLDYWKDYNIEIEYLIPSEFSEGIPLLTDNLSFSSSKHEFLINMGSLCKITDVMIEEDKAYLTAVFVPKKIWEKGYNNQNRK